MTKQSNSNSKLLDQLVKAAKSTEAKPSSTEFANQIMRTLAHKDPTLEEVFSGMFKNAQGIDSIPGEDVAAPGADPLVGVDPLGDELGEEPLGGEEAPDDPAALVSEALGLLERANTAMGGGEELGGEGELGDELAGDDLAEAPELNGDIGMEELEPEPMAAPSPMAAPAPAPMPAPGGMV